MTERNVENRTIFVSDNLPILKGLNRDAVRVPHKDGAPHTGGFSGAAIDITDPSYAKTGKVPETWWEIAIAPRSSKEYVGYPTQSRSPCSNASSEPPPLRDRLRDEALHNA